MPVAGRVATVATVLPTAVKDVCLDTVGLAYEIDSADHACAY